MYNMGGHRFAFSLKISHEPKKVDKQWVKQRLFSAHRVRMLEKDLQPDRRQTQVLESISLQFNCSIKTASFDPLKEVN